MRTGKFTLLEIKIKVSNNLISRGVCKAARFAVIWDLSQEWSEHLRIVQSDDLNSVNH